MSLWACPRCHTLQAFSVAMTCDRCGGHVVFADVRPIEKPPSVDAVDPSAADPGTLSPREKTIPKL